MVAPFPNKDLPSVMGGKQKNTTKVAAGTLRFTCDGMFDSCFLAVCMLKASEVMCAVILFLCKYSSQKSLP